jgi:MFS family permease
VPVAEAAAARRATFRDVFAIGEFRWLWVAYLMSIAGDQLALVALTVLVYARTGSPLATAAAYTVGFLPWLIGGTTLAKLADRFPRRTVMISCDVTSMVLVGVMAVPVVPLWALIVLLFVVTLIDSPFRAARSAMMPDILPGDRYVLGTATMQTTNRTGRLLGFAVGGAIVGLVGARPAMAIDAATFAASALLLRSGVRHRPLPDHPGVGAKQGKRDGSAFRLVFGDRTLRSLMLLGWLVPFYAVPEALAVPYAAHFGGGPSTAGLILAAGPFGSLMGTIAFSRLVDPPTRLAWMRPLAVSCCAVLGLCALDPALGLALAIIAAAGALSAYQLAANAEFVTTVPSHRRGQAFGLANGGISVGQGLWFAVAGLGAEAIGPAKVIAASGAVGAAAALAIAVSWRGHRPHA